MVIASVSGGKDSAAMCLHLREKGIEHKRVFMDTGWEHPDLYEHIEYLADKLGPIKRLRMKPRTLPPEVLARVEEIEEVLGIPDSAMVRLLAWKGMFPSRKIRFCTEHLKVLPFIAYAKALDADVVNAVGIRAEESQSRSRMVERE